MRHALPQLLTVGRINMDLYVDQLGVPIAEATSFRASVGGSPTNTAIVAQRLGMPAAVLSATGSDYAGELVVNQLADFGVSTAWVQRLPSGSTSLALLATLSADEGERQFYRDDPADAKVDAAIVPDLPWDSLRVVALSADALARGSMAETVAAVAKEAGRRGVPVWWDLDLRPSSWPDRATYAKTVRPAIAGATVVIGTEDEFAHLVDQDLADATTIRTAAQESRVQDVVLKLGSAGAMLISEAEPDLTVGAVSAAPVCTVGGGDATAGTLVAARSAGLSWKESLELSMRVAGWTVEQPFCSTGFPNLCDLGLDPLFGPGGQRARS